MTLTVSVHVEMPPIVNSIRAGWLANAPTSAFALDAKSGSPTALDTLCSQPTPSLFPKVKAEPSFQALWPFNHKEGGG